MSEEKINIDLEKELIDITRQLLIESDEGDRNDIRLDSSFSRHLGVDSLSRAELFQRIARRMQVDFPDSLLAEAETLNDIAEYMQTHHVGLVKPMKQQVIRSHGDRPHLQLEDVQTLIGVILEYGEKAPDKAHIYFQHEDGSEEVVTYGQLLEASLKVAQGLRQLGLYEGETVAIMQPSHPRFFYTFIGTLLAGGIPVPIYPPYRMHMLEAYARTEARILTNAEARILVTFDRAEKLGKLLKSFVPSLKHVTTAEALLTSTMFKDVFRARQDDYAFIQYTSGSTGDPKGVLLTHFNLLSNVRAYGKAIQLKENDVAVSWLPLYHDLGLIGMWLGSLYHGIPLVLMTPFSFLNRPEKWLWAIHRHRGTLSGAPNFAYELCIKKITPDLIEGLDLSSWRMAANGAEKVYPATLERFAEKFAPWGFDKKALYPVYGLAESTVGLLLPPVGREFKTDHVDRKVFEEQKIARPAHNEHSLTFVSCGKPIPGHEVRIVNKEDQALGEREVGVLQFKGPSNMQGYYNNPKATKAAFHDGWIDSGDLAYQADGECYITGRQKDLIVKAGRNLYPAEMEEIVGKMDGIREGCVAVFGVDQDHQGTEQLVVVAETKEKGKARRAALKKAINSALSDELDVVPDQVVLVEPRTVPKTSSGKLQRAACKQMYKDNLLKKSPAPTWWQIGKLGLSGTLHNIQSVCALVIKTAYTFYAVAVFGIWLIPVFIVAIVASRDFTASFMRYWAKSLLMAVFCPVTIIGREKLDAKQVVIYALNHASYLDSIVSLAVMPPNTRMIGKKELLSAPLSSYFMRKLGYVGIDRIDINKGLADTKIIEERLKAGSSILIFPEGTFSYSSGLRPFRLGAFKIAVDSGTPVQPVALQGTRKILRGSERLMYPGSIKVHIGDPVKPDGSEWQDVIRLRDRVKEEIAKHCGEPSLEYITSKSTNEGKPHQ